MSTLVGSSPVVDSKARKAEVSKLKDVKEDLIDPLETLS